MPTTKGCSAEKPIANKRNSHCVYTGTRKQETALASVLDETHMLTQIPGGKLHQHKLQPRLLTPSQGFGCSSAAVCAATALAISNVLQVR